MDDTYHKLHRNLARNLRKQQTTSEQHLWQFLRKRQLDGHRFRRQTPIGRYIVDFVNLEKRLIIELDGKSHLDQQAYDQVRDDWLQQQNFRVLRFRNFEVFDDIEGVLRRVLVGLNRG